MLYGDLEALISVDLSDLRSDADAFWIVVDEGSSMGYMNYAGESGMRCKGTAEGSKEALEAYS